MRSLSFRSQLLLLMLTPVLVTTAVLGWLAYRAARETVIEGAMRAVGIAANAREQALVMRLRRQQERASTFLHVAAARCLASKGPEQGGCFQESLANFVATEGVRGARLVVPGLEPLLVGERTESLLMSPLPPGQLARFEPKRDEARTYSMLLQEGVLVLGLRYDAALLEPIFQERHGLGGSGETFLADSQGLFITKPKYPGHSGEHHSHPIDARPMRECLSGHDAEILAGDYRDVPVIHGFRFIEEIGGGCIMAHIEQAEAFAPARTLRNRVIEAAVALALLAVGLSFVFSRRLSRPVSRLTDKARALQAGDFDVTVPAEGPRELKTFAETFTKMARSLQVSTEERSRLLVREMEARREVEAKRSRLEVIAGLSRALAESRLALETILETTCRQLAERVGDVCLLRLLSADGQWLEGRAVFARDPNVEERARSLMKARPQRVIEGVSARVLASGEPLMIPVVTQEVLERVLATMAPEYREFLTQFTPHSFVSLPLRASERILGVLTLLRLEPDASYTEDDLILLREIADRTALAIENARLFQQEQEAVRVREDMVAVVSHDLRNPISAISMSASVLLKREGLLDWQAKGLSRIYSAADRALRLIRDLLDSTQARVSGIPVEPRPLDFHELAGHVVEEVQLAHPERPILFHTSGDAHGAWDGDRVAQVITNLVGNAVQHSPSGTPVRVDSRGVDGVVLLEVHNEGPAIPADMLPRLFEPFRRGRGAAGGTLGSLGLGLFISRRLVEAHAGSIEVKSAEGEGTTFTVRLPRTLPPAPTAP
ncbi:MAG TPA: ATP-binding protein [Archangium sp.]|jgi:signal transduction histidine kinase/HAMP domain-containing protein|uniref:ATP-binding protein n=1 Tax=Archangium sp. TaxID=1872627 RepID=UPI002ED84F0A